MDINGVHLVPSIDANSPDGFSYMATRQVPASVPKTVGPILGTEQAIAFARTWADPANPPALPMVTPQVEASPENAAPEVLETVVNASTESK